MRPALLALLAALLLSPRASACWSLDSDPRDIDLVVVGRLESWGTGLSRAHGRWYERFEGTIRVEEVVFAEAGAHIGDTVELFAAQPLPNWTPRVWHSRHALQRGVWWLQRTATPGIYTSYMGSSCSDDLRELDAFAPAARIVAGSCDPTTGVFELEVRYENPSQREASIDEVCVDADGRVAGLDGALVLLAGSIRPRDSRHVVQASAAATGRVRVPARRYVRRWVRLAVPGLMRVPFCALVVGRSRECAIVRDRRPSPDDHDHDEPLFLAPNDPAQRVVVPARCAGPLLAMAPVAGPLLAMALVGLAPLVTRGRAWRWRPRARALGASLLVASLACVVVNAVGPGVLL
jgi:hypothetical protein